jgi:hypothetical protein
LPAADDAESAMNRALFIGKKVFDEVSEPVQEDDALFGYSVWLMEKSLAKCSM